MNCFHQYDYYGGKLYGNNVPAFAQGAYPPGDEPGVYCDQTGEPCINYGEDNPEDCPVYIQTPYYCPACLEDGEETRLFLCRDVYHCPCPQCGEEFSQAELMDKLSSQAAEYRKRFEGAHILSIKVEQLEEVLARVCKALVA